MASTSALSLLLLFAAPMHHEHGSSHAFTTSVKRRHNPSASVTFYLRRCVLSSSAPDGAVEFQRHDRDIIGSGDDEHRHETLASLSEKINLLLRRDHKGAAHEKVDAGSEVPSPLARTRLAGLHLNRTALGPSTIPGAGRGLFATCDSIRAGDLLTCYPGDALVTFLGAGDNRGEGTAEYAVRWSDHVPPEQRPARLDDDLRGYMLHAQDNYGVLGLPALDRDPAYLGHFVNDGGRLLSQAGFTDYVMDSFEKANAKHRDVDGGQHSVLVATRDLRAGEEVFVTYGPDYWMERPGFVDDGGNLDGEDGIDD